MSTEAAAPSVQPTIPAPPAADQPQPPPPTDTQPAAHQAQPPPPPPIPFSCHMCGMHQLCNYRGQQPPFAPVVRLAAPFYVKRNPFAPPPSADRPSAEYYLLIGADCDRCERPVCRGAQCSVFYARTVCLECAQRHLADYPTEMRTRINRAVCERAARE